MASTYPGSLDAFTTIASDKKTSDSVGGRTHRDMHNDLGDAIEAVQAELGTDPAGSFATVKARLDAQVHLGSGTGSPESVVTGTVGQTWLQTDAATATGWLLWQKNSGSSNTGWGPSPSADTGWRTVTMEVGVTGTLLLRRSGFQVFANFQNVACTADAILYNLPVGFRRDSKVTAMYSPISSQPAVVVLATTQLAAVGVWSSVRGLFVYTTDNAWPASLPGTAA